MSVPRLPEEILEQIFNCLSLTSIEFEWQSDEENHDKLKTLRNASLASKACNRAVQAALHHTINLNGRKEDERLKGLLDHIAAQPPGAGLIRCLVAGCHDVRPDQPGDRYLSNFPRLTTRTIAMMDHIVASEDYTKRLRTGLEDHPTQTTGDAALALLLCLISPKVESLELVIPIYSHQSLLIATFEEALSGQPLLAKTQPTDLPFANLREVKVEHWDTENTVDISQVLVFLQLPSLHTFRASKLSCCAAQRVPTETFTSKVTAIDLGTSLLDAMGLRYLLESCKDLKSLSMAWGDACNGDCELEIKNIGDVLRRYGQKLESLSLDVAHGDYFFDDSFGDEIGNLRGLSEMKRLALSYSAFFGDVSRRLEDTPGSLTSMLPTGLLELHILQDQARAMEAPVRDRVYELVADSRFQDLAVVRVDGDNKWSQDLLGTVWTTRRTLDDFENPTTSLVKTGITYKPSRMPCRSYLA